jgi:chromate transporter
MSAPAPTPSKPSSHPSSPPSSAPSSPPLSITQAIVPPLAEIYSTFSKVALSGFGGVLPVSRHALVEKKKWLTEKEFAELLAIAQLLPGPNIVNLSVALGDRFHGVPGSLAAVAGLFSIPFLLFMTLGWGYHFFSDSLWLKKALLGISAAAAGLIICTAMKLAKSMSKKFWAYAVTISAFVGIVVLHRPLFQVVLVVGIAGVAMAYRFESDKQ